MDCRTLPIVIYLKYLFFYRLTAIILLQSSVTIETRLAAVYVTRILTQNMSPITFI